MECIFHKKIIGVDLMKSFSKELKSCIFMVLLLAFYVSSVFAQTVVPGDSLAAKLTWLQRNVDSHNIYIIEINSNENIDPQRLEYRGAINISITLRGNDDGPYTLRLRSHGSMFTISSDVTLILDNNIILHGHNGNNASLVTVNGGTLIMNEGVVITGNIKSAGGGGGVDIPSGLFTMNGGIISDNIAAAGGGGVCICGGTFTMNSGTISGNRATDGGGVQVNDRTFNMVGGIISGNIATNRGGGVYMIDGRTSTIFTMRGGTITGNTAGGYGGGIFVTNNRYITFTKTGGTITGYNSDQENGNVVMDDDGTIARRGHAVFVSVDRRKETTAEVNVNLSRDADAGYDR